LQVLLPQDVVQIFGKNGFVEAVHAVVKKPGQGQQRSES
jgi:hypothetical protein